MSHQHLTKILSEEDFNLFHAGVLATRLAGRHTSGKLMLLTDDYRDLPEELHRYIEREKPLGYCVSPTGWNEKVFEVWVTPAYQDSTQFRCTLLHELLHGYVGISYGHNAHWRKHMYSALFHMAELGLMQPQGDEQVDPEDIARYGLRNYVKDVHKEAVLRHQAIEQAKGAHPLVRELFNQRKYLTPIL